MKIEFTDKYSRLTDHLSSLIDDQLGIIKSVFLLDKHPDSPDFYYYKAIVSNTSIFNGVDNIGITAGTSADPEKALIKAVGEAIERYCCAIYRFDDLIFSSYSDLKEKALHPSEMKYFLDEQYKEPNFPINSIDESSKLHWTKAKCCHTEESILIPAAHTYCPYEPNLSKKEDKIAENISTGLAAHCSYEEAAINGFMEVIERNNFMFTWLTKQSPSIVNIESLTPHHHELIERYRISGYQFILLYNTGIDGIPSFIGSLIGKNKNTVPIIIGSTCHLNPETAVTKCLEELALMERYSRNKMKNNAVIKNYKSVNHLMDHVMLWLNPGFIHNADFLFNSKSYINLSEIENLASKSPELDLSKIINHVEQNGYTCYFADLTTSDIRQFNLTVGRALIPGYIPLNKRYICRSLGAKYLHDHYTSIGFGGDYSSEINQIPHPFA